MHGRDAAREDEVRGELRPLVHRAIAVRVGEDGDDADRIELAAALGVLHVAAHLDDPEPALLVEGELDGVDHEGLRRDELDLEAVLDLEGRVLRLGAERGRGRDLEVGGEIPLGLALAVTVLGDGGADQGEGEKREECGPLHAPSVGQAGEVLAPTGLRGTGQPDPGGP